MNKLNRKGFFSTLFGGLAGIVAGITVKASETPTETEITCDKLVFTHSNGVKCELSEKPVVKKNLLQFTNNNLKVYSDGNVGLGPSCSSTRLYIS